MSPVASAAATVHVDDTSLPYLQRFVAQVVDDNVTLEQLAANAEHRLAVSREEVAMMRPDLVDALELLTCWAAFGIAPSDVSPAELQLVKRLAEKYR